MQSDHTEASAAECELRFGPFRMLPVQRALYKGTDRVKLGGRAFDLLVVLSRRPGELVSKEQLFAHVWPNLHVDETALRVHVSALRKALGPGPTGEPYVSNVIGRGYRLIGPVSDGPAPPGRLPVEVIQYAFPRPPTHVIGRADVIASIVRQLPQHRLLTIVGAGGIGKTTVALMVAHRLAHGVPGAARMIDLSPLAEDGLVPAAVAFGLGLPNVADDAAAGVIAHLWDKRLLLVLDCCERVVGGTAVLVEQILAAAPDINILVTSREPLRALGERVIRLAPLGIPATAAGITAADAAAFPAMQLFAERASASLEDFTLSDSNASLVAELCIRLDGIALAIELVAGHVNAFDLQSLADMLNERLSLLGPSRRTVIPRHKTLRAVLDWSFETIAGPERVLLQRMAVFVGATTLAALQAVCAGGELSRLDVPDALRLLVDKSLVVAELAGGSARYRLLDMTRAYAAEKLRESGEADAVSRRHARHLTTIFAAAQETWTTRSVADWLAEYSPSLGDVRAALDWAFSPAGEKLLGVALAAEALPVMFELTLVEECRRRAAVALAALQALAAPDAMLEMRLSLTLGAAMMYTPGPLPPTISTWERVLEIATAGAVRSGEARAAWALWTACIYGGRPRDALGHALRFSAVQIGGDGKFTHLPGERIIGVALHMMGEQHAARSRLEAMLAQYVPSAINYYTPGFQLDQGAMARVTLVRILWVTGLADQALATLVQVLRDVRRTDHALSVGYALIEAAVPVLLMAGDVDGAARELGQLRALADQNGFAIWQAGARAMALAVSAARGEALPAIDVHEAFSGLRATGYMAPAAWLSGVAAEAVGTQESLTARISRISDAIADCERSGELWILPELLRVQALLTGADQPVKARSLLVRAADLARQQGALAWERRIEAAVGQLETRHPQAGP